MIKIPTNGINIIESPSFSEIVIVIVSHGWGMVIPHCITKITMSQVAIHYHNVVKGSYQDNTVVNDHRHSNWGGGQSVCN